MCVAKKRLALLHFDLFCITGSYGEYIVFILVIYFGTWTHSLEPRNPCKIMSISTATSLLSTFCNAYSRLSLGTRIRRNFRRTPKMFHPREANVSLDQKSHASQNKNSPFRYSACIWWSRKLSVGLRGNDLSHISSISSLQLGASHTCFRKERCRVLSIHFALDATISWKCHRAAIALPATFALFRTFCFVYGSFEYIPYSHVFLQVPMSTVKVFKEKILGAFRPGSGATCGFVWSIGYPKNSALPKLPINFTVV